jgi:hypothetical protein
MEPTILPRSLLKHGHTKQASTLEELSTNSSLNSSQVISYNPSLKTEDRDIDLLSNSSLSLP